MAASCATQSYPMLTYAAASYAVHSKDLNPTLRSFKPKALSLCTLALGYGYGERKSGKLSLYSNREVRSGFVSAAVATDTTTAPPPKSKTGKAALPLKRDRAMAEFKKGKVEYRADKTGIVHIPFGKVNFFEEDLLVNFLAAVKSIEANKPSGAKGVYWKIAHICSSMGPSIRLNIREMLNYKLT